jgi:Zn-dependent protease
MPTPIRLGGVPLRVSPSFVVFAVFIALGAARDVSDTTLAYEPHMPHDSLKLAAFLQQSHLPVITGPSPGWVLAGAAATLLAYALSILAHEVGHLGAARAVGVDVTSVNLHGAGGFVEMDDPDHLTAGRLAAIAAAGPAATAAVVLVALIVMRVLGLPADAPKTGLAAAAGSVLTLIVGVNAVALAINLLPFGPLDGRKLVTAGGLWLRRGGW